jgi:hypothetical protein
MELQLDATITVFIDSSRSAQHVSGKLLPIFRSARLRCFTAYGIVSKSNTKWTTFTYASPQIRKITNLFRHTNVKIAVKWINKISRLMKPNIVNNTPYYNRTGIYKLTCNTCKLACVGQTSRSLKLRFQEHIRYIRHNNPQSAYAQHILRNLHEYGPIDHLMTILKPLNDTTLLTPYEQYFIQTLYQKGQLITEQPPGGKNPSPACH